MAEGSVWVLIDAQQQNRHCSFHMGKPFLVGSADESFCSGLMRPQLLDQSSPGTQGHGLHGHRLPARPRAEMLLPSRGDWRTQSTS